MLKRVFTAIMLIIVIGAVKIMLIDTNYVYAQWIIPSDLSGIHENMHHTTFAITSAGNNNQTTTITNKR
jgi:hypothetical protein